MRKGAATPHEFFHGQHRLEHWYGDNSLYFLTIRCSDQFPAFASEPAKEIFWRQFTKYFTDHHFDVFVCTLMTNHYHAVGYFSDGNHLAPMLQKIHGSVSKLVNDLLPQRRVPFWSEYFDGCLRDEKQYRRAYRYTQLQSVRHGICRDWREYKHTRVYVDLKDGLKIATTKRAFLPMVPYKRSEPNRPSHGD
ncbi:MAG TPA: hypothetical protein VHX86_16280 [Tepidisphaeraceae bacterium]|jgi:hypothetical protein|nr:hypothetical protein [Tepidisphaeraceae bacterium]